MPFLLVVITRPSLEVPFTSMRQILRKLRTGAMRFRIWGGVSYQINEIGGSAIL